MSVQKILKINTIEELEKFFRLPPANNPLIYVVRLAEMKNFDFKLLPQNPTVQFGLYSIVLKQGVKCVAQYGWRQYDFSKGVMSFSAPGQIFSWITDADYSETTGSVVVFHPDLIRKYSLGTKIGKYKFFSYEINEALHVSDSERIVLENIIDNIAIEIDHNIDEHSQDIVVSQIDVLLNYAERFYKRQFNTRNSVESDVLVRFETILRENINKGDKLISAQELASQLSMSTQYLSDLLRNLTGMTTQQHIHNYLIERAKTLLHTTNLSVNEIAYSLGFDYPQYFNRLFKQKVGKTPVEFRNAQ